MNKIRYLFGLIVILLPTICLAGGGGGQPIVPNILNHSLSKAALLVFVLAYALVMVEEYIHLRKSKPVILASGIIWIIVSYLAAQSNNADIANEAVRHNILEYAELFLFLLVAMTYVNAMEERNVFETLRAYLVRKGFSYKKLFWTTGWLAFFISPIADNLTTALLMCAVVMAVGQDNKKFVAISCVNIVVAANAGGAFSPFGDITTLMVWQKGILPFFDFFVLFIPATISYVIPAGIMHMALPEGQPNPIDENVQMRIGAKRIICLFLVTIATAVCFHNFLHLPPVVGMMTGLSFLKLFGYYLKQQQRAALKNNPNDERYNSIAEFDIFKRVKDAEWDTLFFFYGIILCVGGLATMGYLEITSQTLYHDLGANLSEIHRATPANAIVGILSAIVDNIPVMFAVLTMHPLMSEGQWLLVTLTAGIGGSLLSIGSAAGVALMGQSKGLYTFGSHLKWSWAIFIGYVAGIICHIWLNADLFHKAIN